MKHSDPPNKSQPRCITIEVVIGYNLKFVIWNLSCSIEVKVRVEWFLKSHRFAKAITIFQKYETSQQDVMEYLFTCGSEKVCVLTDYILRK